MGFPRISYSYILLILVIFAHISFPQIIFKELPGYQADFSDSSFFRLSETRNIIPLNGKWEVYSADDDKQKKIPVYVPSIFKGNAELVFEKTFILTSGQLKEKKIKLYFLGLNYIADVIINDIVVYRHRGGEYPFTIDLPKDILHTEKSNLLSVKLFYKPDPENTIPLKQKFLFPESFGGIIRDVYLYFEPEISIAGFDFTFNRDLKTTKIQLNLSERLENKEFRRKTDTLDIKNEFKILINIYNPDRTPAVKSAESKFQLKPNENRELQHSFEISNPYLWSPESPDTYLLEISLLLNDQLKDRITKEFPIYFLSSSFDEVEFNGQNFSFKGVTYIPSFGEFGSLASFKKMEEDIKIISETGFNSVRFAKSVPHPYYLRLCEKSGLLPFIEIPLNYVPAGVSSNPDFITRSKNYLSEFINGYSEFGKIAAIGLGSSYLADLKEHQVLINELESVVPKEKGLLSYASFTGIKPEKINNLNLYGIEISGDSFEEDTTGISLWIDEFGKGNVFLSSVTYFVNSGNSNGYSNKNTYEAQAKYFEDLISAFPEEKISGYFINTMFNYRGDYSSLLSGYNKNNIYNIGLISEERGAAYLSHKVIKAKLQNAERVTIPIGTKSDNAPMEFIIIGLGLALIIGILVNSGRKFREDASRALLRPYNFYADVRDQRMISSYHSTVMAIVLAVVMALLISSLLFYLKDNILFERILLSFGSTSLIEKVSYLAWNPLYAIVWLSLAFIVLIILSVIVIKFSSLFVKNRVYISGIYFSVVWALLPLILLIPVGIVLYRALHAEVANIYIYAGLLLFALWIFYRLMKGIYVIFDINPGRVYFYSIVIVLVLIGFILIYYEVKNSFIDYLLLTFKQYNIKELL